MALQHMSRGQRVLSYQDLVRVLLIVAVAITLLVVVTLIAGVQRVGPPYEIVPDPAGLLSF